MAGCGRTKARVHQADIVSSHSRDPGRLRPNICSKAHAIGGSRIVGRPKFGSPVVLLFTLAPAPLSASTDRRKMMGVHPPPFPSSSPFSSTIATNAFIKP